MSGFCGGTIGDNDIATVWDALGPDDELRLSARPGETPRNREMRCEHGFVRGAACQVCNCSTIRAASAGPNSTQMSHMAVTRRVKLARKIHQGVCTIPALAAEMHTTIGAVAKTLAGMRRSKLITTGSAIALTERGKEML